MNMQLYEKLKRQYEAERRSGLEAVETEYAKNIEALERVWASIHGKQSRAPESTIIPTISQEISTPKTRTQGVTKAVEQAVYLLEGDYTADEVMERVEGINLTRQSVTDSLWRLEKQGIVETVVQGKGKRKGVYRTKKGGESHNQTLIEADVKPSEGLPM